jgi:pimeloyl-ACP methyl ester carboxylesterase
MGLPLHVQTVEWSHGYGRMFADHVDYRHARAEGMKLATQIACYRQAQGQGPPLPVYLVAHSGGSAVVLAAAELLPPDSVERIVLLAPSVSADYDLRPALRCARQGVDVFYSSRDLGYLGLGVGLFGTGDRRWSAASGRVGFRLPADADAEGLYTRLHQHPWVPAVSWTGNEGGHFGSHRDRFLRAYIMPLLLPQAAV